MLPAPQFALEVPAMLAHSQRLHNQFVKRAVRVEIEHHWKTRIPRHFVQSARARYGYARRNPRYVRMKLRRYRTGTDLVKTGATRRLMIGQARIQVGGTVGGTSRAGPGVTATLRLRFPFPGGVGGARGRQGITIDQMRREVAALAPDERADIRRSLADNYSVLVDTEPTTRQRIKVPVGFAVVLGF